MLGYKHMKMAISVACNPVEHDRCAEINTYKDKYTFTHNTLTYTYKVMFAILLIGKSFSLVNYAFNID